MDCELRWVLMPRRCIWCLTSCVLCESIIPINVIVIDLWIHIYVFDQQADQFIHGWMLMVFEVYKYVVFSEKSKPQYIIIWWPLSCAMVLHIVKHENPSIAIGWVYIWQGKTPLSTNTAPDNAPWQTNARQPRYRTHSACYKRCHVRLSEMYFIFLRLTWYSHQVYTYACRVSITYAHHALTCHAKTKSTTDDDDVVIASLIKYINIKYTKSQGELWNVYANIHIFNWCSLLRYRAIAI